jgi:hypothetical protein
MYIKKNIFGVAKATLNLNVDPPQLLSLNNNNTKFPTFYLYLQAYDVGRKP